MELDVWDARSEEKLMAIDCLEKEKNDVDSRLKLKLRNLNGAGVGRTVYFVSQRGKSHQ